MIQLDEGGHERGGGTHSKPTRRVAQDGTLPGQDPRGQGGEQAAGAIKGEWCRSEPLTASGWCRGTEFDGSRAGEGVLGSKNEVAEAAGCKVEPIIRELTSLASEMSTRGCTLGPHKPPTADAKEAETLHADTSALFVGSV